MAMKLYIVAYDIADPKRLSKVRKVAYSFAFGGQKSTVESYLDRAGLVHLERRMLALIDPERDKINIVSVKEEAILLGKAKRLSFDKGVIVV